MGAVEDALEYFRNLAEDLGYDENDSEAFVNDSMQRKGFKQVSSWAENDGGKDDRQGTLPFQRSGQKREQRSVPRGRSDRNSGFTQYGS